MKTPYFAVILIVLQLPCFADTLEHRETSTIKQYKININKLRAGIQSHKFKIKESDGKEITILEELKQIDDRVSAQKKRIVELKKLIYSQEELITAKETELLEVILERTALHNHLQERLKSFYLMGKTGFLNVGFSNKNLPDLLLFKDSYRDMVTYDRSIFAAYRKTIGQLESVKQAHELEKSVLQNFVDDAATEQETLHAIAEDKNSLLKRVKSQKGLYEQAIKEMKAAEGNLTFTLTTLKQKKETKIRGFLLNKGKLSAPVAGKILYRFEKDLDKKESKELFQGLTIKTPEGATVYAVYNGTVIYSGYMAGYGKMVIIDHGLEYFSITARLDEINIKEGQHVKQGQDIGLTGDIATLFGKGLYFEIRHGSTPEDPQDWLSPEAYALN